MGMMFFITICERERARRRGERVILARCERLLTSRGRADGDDASGMDYLKRQRGDLRTLLAGATTLVLYYSYRRGHP